MSSPANQPEHEEPRDEHYAELQRQLAELTRINKALQLDEARLEALQQLNQMSGATLQDIAEFTMDEGIRLTGSTLGYLAFVSEDEQRLTIYAWSRQAMRECVIAEKPLEYSLVSTGLWGEAVRQRKPIITNDYAAPNPWNRGYPAGHVELSRHMNVPIFDGEHIVALLGVGNKAEEYDSTDIRQLELLGTGMWHIFQRSQAEETVRKSEAMLSSILNSVPQSIFWKDRQSVYLGCNEVFARTAGLDRPESVIGKTDFDFPVSPEEAEAFRADDREVMETGVPKYHIVESVQQADGTRLWSDTTKVPLRDTDGQISGVLGVFEDITERKQTEEALQENMEKYSILFAAEPDALLLLDVDSLHILDANDAALQMFGYTREELLAQTILALSAEPATTFASICSKKVGELSHIPLRYYQRKDGSTFPVEISARVFTQRGKLMIFAAIRNISERLSAEETIQQERAYLASAIELLPFPILFITPAQDIIRQNRASLELLHGTNSHCWWGVQLLDPQTHAPLPEQEWPMMRALHGEIMPTTEWLMRLADGREIPILLQGAPIFIGEEFVAVVVAFQDISAVKEADRAKDQFLMVLSHELKTPLTSIIGWTQMAQSAPDVVPEALTIILRNANEQKALLERLLVLSRILTGKLMLQRQRFDLWQLLQQVNEKYLTSARDRQIALVLDLPQEGLSISADSKLLQQALTEALENAITFTGARGSVTVSGRQIAEQAVITIQDSGQGIAREQLPTLLKPFQQLAREELKGGMGVGLALLRGIIEAHGGNVEISSEGPGRGTTVRIELPVEA